eukprot:COSAG01_NODE_3568_length_5925_cov_4.034844_4_plen_185_part_00
MSSLCGSPLSEPSRIHRSDTTALNSWNRRNYVTSHADDPSRPVLVPAAYNEWRNNLVLGRNYYGVRDGNGDGLRNDDGSSFFVHSKNVLYKVGIQFNGGTQIHTIGNLFVNGGAWHLGPTPDVASAFNNTFVETERVLDGSCAGFYKKPFHKAQGQTPGICKCSSTLARYLPRNAGTMSPTLLK